VASRLEEDKTMLLNTEELLALAHGNVGPDRLADLLDRLEHCPDSAAALQVLVTLRANREEALEALREAAESDPIQAGAASRLVTRPAFSSGWALQGLRLAASIALAALVGVWALSSPVGTTANDAPGSYADLATTEVWNVALFSPPGVELTTDDPLAAPSALLGEGRYGEARDLLGRMSPDDPKVALLLGVAEYHLGNYESALSSLRRLHRPDVAEPGVVRQASWYEANALLALQSPMEALLLLERLKTAPASYPLQQEAAAKYEQLWEMLGLEGADTKAIIR
jgi:tetratricopeptide (TPR) repeat protein